MILYFIGDLVDDPNLWGSSFRDFYFAKEWS